MNVSAGIAGPQEDVTCEVGAAEGGSTDPLGHGHDNPFRTAHIGHMPCVLVLADVLLASGISRGQSLDAELVPFRVEHGNVPAVVAVEHGGERGSGVHAAIGVGEGQAASVRVRLGTLADIDV